MDKFLVYDEAGLQAVIDAQFQDADLARLYMLAHRNELPESYPCVVMLAIDHDDDGNLCDVWGYVYPEDFVARYSRTFWRTLEAPDAQDHTRMLHVAQELLRLRIPFAVEGGDVGLYSEAGYLQCCGIEFAYDAAHKLAQIPS